MSEEQEHDPIMYTPISVSFKEQPDKMYSVRRLGVRDVFALSKILARGAAVMSSAQGFDELSADAVGMMLLAGIPYAEDEAIAFLAGVIGVTAEEFSNPEQFGMDAVLVIVEALTTHQDMKAFLSHLGKLTGQLPGM